MENKMPCQKDCPSRCCGCKTTCEEWLSYESEYLAHKNTHKNSKFYAPLALTYAQSWRVNNIFNSQYRR